MIDQLALWLHDLAARWGLPDAGKSLPGFAGPPDRASLAWAVLVAVLALMLLALLLVAALQARHRRARARRLKERLVGRRPWPHQGARP